MLTTNQHHHILVINSCEDLVSLYRDLLSEEGYSVSVLPELPEDLGPISNMSPDLIILDDMWNVTDDRRAPLERLSSHPQTRYLPIVLCTGAIRQVESLMASLRGKNIEVVFKPFDLDHLLCLVSRALGRDIFVAPVAQQGVMDATS